MSKIGLGKSLAAVLLAVGLFSGSADAQGCQGTLYFKAPSDWNAVYVFEAYNGRLAQIPSSNYSETSGFWSFDLSNVVSPEPYFGLANASSAPLNYISPTSWVNLTEYSIWYISTFACPGAGHSIYVMENPLNPGSTYIGTLPASANYFFVKVPQTADWLWSTPQIREVGDSTGKVMTPVPGRCGWFQVVWDQASVPSSAEIYDAQGHMFGAGRLTLSSLFTAGHDSLYYDADADYLGYTDPGTDGSCVSSQGSRFYFMVPEDADWISSTPMVSTDGGETGVAMRPATNMCGWFYMEWARGSVPPEEVIIYSSANPDKKIGFQGLQDGEPLAIPIKDFFMYWGNKIFFIPDDSFWPDDGENLGWYSTDPGVDGVCGFTLAAVIYDTDQSLNPLFSTDGENGGFGACTGVRHGIVKQDLGTDNKPIFNDGNANAILCAGNDTLFRTLFNYTEDVNEVQCYDMPFRHYGSDPRWGFDSDSADFDGYNGFHPLENSTDATVVTSISPKPCPDCRYKRYSQGPVPYTYTGDFDKYCNTYGWSGGVECEGKFNNGDSPAVWNWGAPRWEGSHNQQFCFESHATFTYQEDQEFTFRGDDDIWVFINKKLALDNGGAHLAAPGHVVLKNLNDTYGEDFLVPGKEYPLDIFFCDRRTTMSNVIIKTNMFISQTSGSGKSGSGLSATENKNSDGSSTYELCYDKGGTLSCAEIATGQKAVHACGKDIRKLDKSLSYSIVNASGKTVASLTSGASGAQYGGIFLENAYAPKVDVSKIAGLEPGLYNLAINVCDPTGDCVPGVRISFRVNSSLDVVTKTSSYKVAAGEEKSNVYESGTSWKFVGEAQAGTLVPVYVTTVTDKDIDLLSGAGQTYTLKLSEGLIAYADKAGKTKAKFPRTVGSTGIDTIWVTMDKSEVSSTTEASVTLKSEAKITFTVEGEGESIRKVVAKRSPVAFSVEGRVLHIKGAANGSPYALFDMQGRVIKKGLALSMDRSVALPHAGNYLLLSGARSTVVRVK